jgi:hypothetical protein
MLAAPACFLRSMCPALSSATPSRLLANNCSTPCTTDTAATFDSIDGPPASVVSVLLGPPVESPQPLPGSRISCCSPQMSCVSGAPDQVSDDEIPIPRLRVTAPPGASAHAAATLPADCDDEVPIPRFSYHTALVSCHGDAEVSLPRPSVSRPSSSKSPPIFRPQPAPQVGGRG